MGEVSQGLSQTSFRYRRQNSGDQEHEFLKALGQRQRFWQGRQILIDPDSIFAAGDSKETPVMQVLQCTGGCLGVSAPGIDGSLPAQVRI
jgi:hypothetical protein